MSHLPFRAFLVLALFPLFFPSLSPAATVYENRTFTTFAGPPESGTGWYDGPVGSSRFNLSFGLGVDASGNVFVADTANHTIRKITPAGTVTTVAGLAGVSGSA